MPVFRSISTRALLIFVLLAVTATITGGSLLIVRNRVRHQVAQELSADLAHSLITFENLQRQHRDSLIHEDALLSRQPSLKALMTTNDKRTIADGALDLWKVAGSDLFALADRHGQILTVDVRNAAPTSALSDALQETIARPEQHYVSADGRLFDVSARPLYFGDELEGTLLGFVLSGYRIDSQTVRLIGEASGDEATFLAGSRVLASTLPEQRQHELVLRYPLLAEHGDGIKEVSLGGEQFLATETDLSAESASPLRLVVLKSYEQANRATREINRLVLLLGGAALVLGSILMIALSHIVTGPLEMLAHGVRAFGRGDPEHRLPDRGTREVDELSKAFAAMRSQILKTNRALLDAERLATIGSMASSVSHDLRHYLAAVYANAEFLSASKLSTEERSELFADIQVAVHGATELLDSLLIFSKTGAAFHCEQDSLLRITRNAIVLLKAHPEAEGTTIRTECLDADGGTAMVDSKQMQRAIYNLLLNACQSARRSEGLREVQICLMSSEDEVTMTITDTGPGVAAHIRDSLFQPFVSDGKQSGTGLGLTLANLIAKEHGGEVRLLRTRRGETTFELGVRKNLHAAAAAHAVKQDVPVPNEGGKLQ